MWDGQPEWIKPVAIGVMKDSKPLSLFPPLRPSTV
jgi:hypothetical protein